MRIQEIHRSENIDDCPRGGRQNVATECRKMAAGRVPTHDIRIHVYRADDGLEVGAGPDERVLTVFDELWNGDLRDEAIGHGDNVITLGSKGRYDPGIGYKVFACDPSAAVKPKEPRLGSVVRAFGLPNSDWEGDRVFGLVDMIAEGARAGGNVLCSSGHGECGEVYCIE